MTLNPGNFQMNTAGPRLLGRLLLPLLFVAVVPSVAVGKGGNYHTEDRYNPQHMSSLPPEIRNSILHRCKEPKVLHSFASYSDDSKRIVLHFEHFICDGDGTYCSPSGCLHQVWASVRGHYRLMRSYYAPAGD
jgi:hypothetical protein